MLFIKNLIRSSLSRWGYIIKRKPANRFDGMIDALLLLKNNGFNPSVILDCGANMGMWTSMCTQIFPKAQFHLVEPQNVCISAIKKLFAHKSDFFIHNFALTEPGVENVRMVGMGNDGGSSGAWVAKPNETAEGEAICPAITLDLLFSSRISSTDRILLKLDLEGHEVPALTGAKQLLKKVEVVLMELQFFEINKNGRPVFSDIINLLREDGFILYDFAALSGRPRDMRLRMGDVIFVRQDSILLSDSSF